MKIAIILEASDLINRKGYLNAVHNRILHLVKFDKLMVDVYVLHSYNVGGFRAIKGKTVIPQENSTVIDGIVYNILPYPCTLIDYIVKVRMGKSPYLQNIYINRYVDKFRIYKLIITHSTGSTVFGQKVKDKFGIPYIANWHGSDIHSEPLASKHKYNVKLSLVKGALHNVYVSEALMEKSFELFGKHKASVIYNGVSNDFYPLPMTQKKQLIQKFKCENKKVIAFVGGLLAIKNIFSLPEIFSKINQETNDCVFWIIGDGKYREELKNRLDNTGIEYVMHGNILPSKMNGIYNCIDLLILPSLNEGLPLVVVEALKCGCNVVGSNVGGISEAIGIENVFDLGDHFEENIALRANALLKNNQKQILQGVFDWEKSAELEYDMICNHVKCQK